MLKIKQFSKRFKRVKWQPRQVLQRRRVKAENPWPACNIMQTAFSKPSVCNNNLIQNKSMQGLFEAARQVTVDSIETHSEIAVSSGMDSFKKNAMEHCAKFNNIQSHSFVVNMFEKVFWNCVTPLDLLDGYTKKVDYRLVLACFYDRCPCLSEGQVNRITDVRELVVTEMRRQNPDANVKWFSSQLLCRVIGMAIGVKNCNNICTFQPHAGNSRVKQLNMGLIMAHRKNNFMKCGICLF